MANPQLKNGHTRIANELLNEIMKMNLNGTQFRLIIAIWRYTYGFQKKDNELSIRFLSEKINANKRQVDRELKNLIDKNIVKVISTGGKGARVLQVNKNHEEWGESIDKAPSSLKKEEKPKKKLASKKQKYPEDNTYYKMAVYFHKKITAVAKEAGVEHLVKKANLQSYADDFRKLIELDGVTKKQAKEVMDWVTKDPFWKTNILSARKLREKFAELAIKKNVQQKQMETRKQPKDHRDKEIEFQKWIQNGGDPDDFNWNG